jgi:hypothetical protein
MARALAAIRIYARANDYEDDTGSLPGFQHTLDRLNVPVADRAVALYHSRTFPKIEMRVFVRMDHVVVSISQNGYSDTRAALEARMRMYNALRGTSGISQCSLTEEPYQHLTDIFPYAP